MFLLDFDGSEPLRVTCLLWCKSRKKRCFSLNSFWELFLGPLDESAAPSLGVGTGPTMYETEKFDVWEKDAKMEQD